LPQDNAVRGASGEIGRCYGIDARRASENAKCRSWWKIIARDHALQDLQEQV